jgi:hypothetical protein
MKKVFLVIMVVLIAPSLVSADILCVNSSAGGFYFVEYEISDNDIIKLHGYRDWNGAQIPITGTALLNGNTEVNASFIEMLPIIHGYWLVSTNILFDIAKGTGTGTYMDLHGANTGNFTVTRGICPFIISTGNSSGKKN